MSLGIILMILSGATLFVLLLKDEIKDQKRKRNE